MLHRWSTVFWGLACAGTVALAGTPQRITIDDSQFAPVSPTAGLPSSWHEEGDAPDGVPDRQDTIGDGELFEIRGILDRINGDFIDTYSIVITDVSEFYATTKAPLGGFAIDEDGADADTVLWLWDENGNVLLGNDDVNNLGGDNFASLISDPSTFATVTNGDAVHPTAAGISLVEGQKYLITIAEYPSEPRDSSGRTLVDVAQQSDALHGPNPIADEFSSWAPDGVSDIVRYKLSLRGCGFCEPLGPTKWMEDGDAGDFPAGVYQQTIGDGPLRLICGETNDTSDPIDAYCIRITDPDIFFATTSVDVHPLADADFDTRLWLFDMDGNVLMGNNNLQFDPVSAGSQEGAPIHQSLVSDPDDFADLAWGIGETTLDPIAPGVGNYILVIAGSLADPVDAMNSPLILLKGSNSIKLVGPGTDPAEFAAWESANADTGEYTIALRGCEFCTPPGCNAQEVVELLPPYGKENDFFGAAVAVQGKHVIVGAPNEALGIGGAYVFKDSADSTTQFDSWVLEDALEFPSATQQDRFGTSVDIDGEYAVVGADGDYFDHGAAHVFRSVPAVTNGGPLMWLHEQQLNADDGDFADGFGISAAIDENYILVGAPYHNNHGAAYLFHREMDPILGSMWVQVKKFELPNLPTGSRFGQSVDIDVGQDLLFIGAPSTNDGLGFVFGYRLRPDGMGGMDWLLELIAGVLNPGTFFGHSLAIDGVHVLVGAPGADSAGPDAGWAATLRYYPDDRGAVEWDFEAVLLASDRQAGDQFGYSVDVHDGVAIIGAPYEDEAGEDAGAAYLYRRQAIGDDTNGAILGPPPVWYEWIEDQKILASDGNDGDFFGFAVAIDRELAAVGATCHAHQKDRTGAAYVYGYACTDAPMQENAAPVIPEGVVVSLWPPDQAHRRFALKDIFQDIDPDGDDVRFIVTGITQDEHVNGLGDGNTASDALILNDGHVAIRPERSSFGNGRVYRVRFLAEDTRGGVSLGTFEVVIPIEEFTEVVDDGQFFDASIHSADEDVVFNLRVNKRDLLLVLEQFGMEGPDALQNLPDGDVDRNGRVDIMDVERVLNELKNIGRQPRMESTAETEQ